MLVHGGGKWGGGGGGTQNLMACLDIEGWIARWALHNCAADDGQSPLATGSESSAICALLDADWSRATALATPKWGWGREAAESTQSTTHIGKAVSRTMQWRVPRPWSQITYGTQWLSSLRRRLSDGLQGTGYRQLGGSGGSVRVVVGWGAGKYVTGQGPKGRPTG